MKLSVFATILVSATLATGAAAQPGAKDPPKTNPRQPIPGLTPDYVVPASADGNEVKPGTVAFCRKELIDGLKECRKSFPAKEDRDLRDQCTSAIREAYPICRSKVAAETAGVSFDADWLSEGLIVVHAAPGQIVLLYRIGDDDLCELAGVLHESPAWDGAYIDEAENVLMELGADIEYLAIAQPLVMTEDSPDFVGVCDLFQMD